MNMCARTVARTAFLPYGFACKYLSVRRYTVALKMPHKDRPIIRTVYNHMLAEPGATVVAYFYRSGHRAADRRAQSIEGHINAIMPLLKPGCAECLSNTAIYNLGSEVLYVLACH